MTKGRKKFVQSETNAKNATSATIGRAERQGDSAENAPLAGAIDPGGGQEISRDRRREENVAKINTEREERKGEHDRPRGVLEVKQVHLEEQRAAPER